MRIPVLLSILLGLSLSSCGHLTQKKDPPPSTDLQLLRAGVEELTRATEVEGEIKKRRDAVTTDDLWKLSGRQDDALTNANDDKRRTNDFVVKATTIIENARRPPCRGWNLACKWRRRNDP